MQRARTQRAMVGLMIVLGLVTWYVTPVWGADSRLLIVAPFKEHLHDPPLLLGLQQVLIDDLHGLFPHRVMPRSALRDLLAAEPDSASTTLYITHIPKLSGRLQTRFVLINDLREDHGTLTWRATLVHGTTGATIEAWTYEGSLERLWAFKTQAVAAVVQHLPAAELRGQAPAAGNADEARLASLASFTRGLEALDKQDYARAVREWRQALQDDPTFSYATRQLEQLRTRLLAAPLPPREQGLWLLADGQVEQAEEALQEAARHSANDGEVWRALGQVALARKNVKLARQHAVKARDLAPARADTWTLLGEVAQTEGKDREAREMFQKAQTLAPTQGEVHRLLAESHTKLRESDKAAPEYVQAGERYMTALRFPEARRMFATAKQLAPQAAEPLVGEGDLLQRLGKPREALTTYTQARSIAPNNGPIARKMGTAYRQLGEMQAAATHYQQALSASADDFDANVHMGQMHLDEQQFERASPYLEKAKKLQPKRPDVQKLLARTYAGMGKREATLQAYRTLLDDGNADVETYQAYGDALAAKGDLSGAALQYRQAVRLDPDAVDVYQRLGKVQEQLGQKSEAAATLTQLKLLQPAASTPAPVAAASAVVITQLQAGMSQLMDSFPEVRSAHGPTTVAAIDLGVFVEKAALLSQLWGQVRGFVTLKKVAHTRVTQAFEQALRQKYQVIPFENVQRMFRIKPYNTMSTKQLDDTSYLTGLCDALDVQALVLYKTLTEHLKAQNAYRLTVREALFNKAQLTVLANEVQMEIPSADITYLNVPYIVVLSGVGLALIAYLTFYLIQGFGSLVVTIQQDNRDTKTFFSVLLSKKSNKDLAKTKRNLRKIVKSASRGGRYEREVRHGFYEHSMVFDRTTFKSLHAGDYYVYLFGVIANAEGEDIGNYQMSQKVTITKGRQSTLEFDLRAKTSRVRVQVLKGDAAAMGAEIAIRGQSESRYIKDNLGALFQLPVGKYTCVIQHEGVLFTEDIEVASLEKGYRFTFTVPTAEKADRG